MMFSNRLRRCLVVLALAPSSVFALDLGSLALWLAGPPGITWEELAAHAGLAGIKPKTKDEFQADVIIEYKYNISALKAAIRLSPEEWAWLSSNKTQHLLTPWYTDQMDNDTWKSTVDLGLPEELLPNGKLSVKVDRLNFTDPAVILRRPDARCVRVYMLSADPGGKSGVLFYFFKDNG